MNFAPAGPLLGLLSQILLESVGSKLSSGWKFCF